MKRLVSWLGLVLIMPLCMGQGCKEIWSLTLSDFYVADADEDSWYSDGDEPYFVLIQFRSTWLEIGSTDVYWSSYLDDDDFDPEEWADGIDTGGSATIPSRMGKVTFRGVTRLYMADIQAGEIPELLGVLAIAMESDATPWGIMEGIFDDAVGAIRDQLVDKVERGSFDPSNPVASLTSSLNQVIDSVQPTALEAIGIGLASLFDPDDVVDAHLFLYVAVDPAVEAVVTAAMPPGTINDPRLTFGTLQNDTFDVNSSPIVFNNDEEEVTYNVGGTWRSEQP